MKKFTSLTKFAEYLSKLEPIGDEHKIAALEVIGKYVKEKAQSKFGVPQNGDGKFPAWPEDLADSTQAQRVKLGFTPNDPLYRNGELMNSIDYKVEPNKLQVGSANPIMEWQEFGTATIPPRPVLGAAMYESVEVIKKALGVMMVNWLTGEKKINKVKK
jgi:hypothetical protein